MPDEPRTPSDPAQLFAGFLEAQGETARHIFESVLPGFTPPFAERSDLQGLADAAGELQKLWRGVLERQDLSDKMPPILTDPAQWLEYLEAAYRQMPLAHPARQTEIWRQNFELWENVLGQYGIGPRAQKADGEAPELPFKDRRFADPRWREQPVFALIHQTYLMAGRQLLAAVEDAEGLDDFARDQLRFAMRTTIEALSPANFPMINPVVLDTTLARQGENLVKGMERMVADLERGQLTHTDDSAFELGKNVAVTPGKVVHETRLFQLIQYSPVTDQVLEEGL